MTFLRCRQSNSRYQNVQRIKVSSTSRCFIHQTRAGLRMELHSVCPRLRQKKSGSTFQHGMLRFFAHGSGNVAVPASEALNRRGQIIAKVKLWSAALSGGRPRCLCGIELGSAAMRSCEPLRLRNFGRWLRRRGNSAHEEPLGRRTD